MDSEFYVPDTIISGSMVNITTTACSTTVQEVTDFTMAVTHGRDMYAAANPAGLAAPPRLHR
jgi:hypothetical protein